jgi:hypothetical protein
MGRAQVSSRRGYLNYDKQMRDQGARRMQFWLYPPEVDIFLCCAEHAGVPPSVLAEQIVKEFLRGKQ